MAQITHVRRFDGVDDRIDFDHADAIVARDNGIWAAILKPATGHDGVTISLLSNVGGGLWQLGTDVGTERIYFHQGGAILQGHSHVTTGDWCFIAATRPPGTTTARWHSYNFDTDTWSHEEDDVSEAEGAALDSDSTLVMGCQDGPVSPSSFWEGDVAVVGAAIALGAEPSDAEVEDLIQGIHVWDSLMEHVWLANQADVAEDVLDRVGDCDQISRVGTTVIEVSDLNFDVGGGGPPVAATYSNFPKYKLRPDSQRAGIGV